MKRQIAAALFAALVLAARCKAGQPPASPSPPPALEWPSSAPPEATKVPSLTEQFTRLHMVGAGQGWAMAGHRLFALTGNGQTWWEVAPPEVAAMDGQNTPYRAAVDFPGGGNSVWLAVSRLDGNSPGAVLYHSVNGSMAWEKAAQLPGAGPTDHRYIRSVSFLDDLHGWAMVHPDDTMGSNPGALYETTDGGRSWALAADTADGSLPYGGEIRFIDSKVGFLSANQASTLPHRLFATRDGGRTWTEATLPLPEGLPAARLDVAFLPAFFGQSEGLLRVSLSAEPRATPQTALYRTTDGGRTWEHVTTRPESAISFISMQEGWAWAGGRLTHTADGGKTWSDLAGTDKVLKPGVGVVELSFINPQDGWLLAWDSGANAAVILRTADGGRFWEAPAMNVSALTPVRTTSDTLDLNGVQWHITRPVQRQALVAAGEEGILWVGYPPLVERDGNDRPAGDWSIFYTPMRSTGGDLAQGAEQVLILPGSDGDRDQRVTKVEAAAGGRFLVYTYSLFPGAATGGTARVWWVYPQEHKSKVVAEGTAGGGSHFMVAADGRWLFWNKGRTDNEGILGGKAGVVDLATAEGREVWLGERNWAGNPQWVDGKLEFTLGARRCALDPTTGTVVALP